MSDERLTESADETPAGGALAGLVALAVLTFVAFAGLCLLAVAAAEPPTEAQRRIGETCDVVVKMSLGLVIGWAGGYLAGRRGRVGRVSGDV